MLAMYPPCELPSAITMWIEVDALPQITERRQVIQRLQHAEVLKLVMARVDRTGNDDLLRRLASRGPLQVRGRGPSRSPSVWSSLPRHSSVATKL
jgi:hypothetical protein